jgi:hypothetical protein
VRIYSRPPTICNGFLLRTLPPPPRKTDIPQNVIIKVVIKTTGWGEGAFALPPITHKYKFPQVFFILNMFPPYVPIENNLATTFFLYIFKIFHPPLENPKKPKKSTPPPIFP